MRASFVIRAKNEADKLSILFPILKNQTEQDFEIIVVDNESRDTTRDVCAKHGVTIVPITNEEFSYPHALNKGISRTQGEYVVLLSAHAFPPTNTWLADGLAHFGDKKVCGVYGPVFFYPDSPFVEKLVWLKNWLMWKLRFILKPRVITKVKMGVLGMTNAIIRKDLWNSYHLNEEYGMGGEDGEWAQHFFDKGYVVVKDPKFAVRHAHYIKTWKDMRKQFEEWRKMAKPLPFQKMSVDFRGDKEKFFK